MATALRIATCLDLPEPDVDEKPLLDALARAGVDARMAAWDDPREDWGAPVPTVIRSTWNYYHRADAFVAWAARAAAAAPLWNPPAVVRWNVHKSYLGALAARGVAAVPTAYVARGERVDLAALCRARGWERVVVKPTVSAGSFGTRRFGADELAAGRGGAAQHFLNELVAAREAMVQPYVASVEAWGERSLVWIDGAFTHAIRKTPRWSGDDEAVSGPLPIEDDERALAAAALAPHAGELLYARVDMARGEGGEPMVMELELVEPSLFLLQHPPALERFVAAIARRLG